MDGVNPQITDLLDNMSECFFSLDKNLHFTYVNKQTERSINLTSDQVLGKCILDIYPTETPNEWQLAYEKVLRERKPFCGELFDTFSHKWYQVSLCPSRDGGIAGFFSDITEKVDRKSERQRLLAEIETTNQSLEAILNQLPAGVFVVYPSGGIIRFNHEAARICGFSVETSLLKTEEWRRCVFHLDGTPLELNEYPLDRVFRNGETVRDEEYTIRRDDGTEVIVNLNASPIVVRNSIEAMPSGGTVTIGTYLDKGNVILAVSDQGSGIPEKVMDKLGTPFITTKEAGTGLGLAVCYRIAQRHRAEIKVETSEVGTTFFVQFRSM